MKTQVSSIPPIMMSLSWVARLSISLITVLDSPSMLATSSIFLWVPCTKPKGNRWQHLFTLIYVARWVWQHPCWCTSLSNVSHSQTIGTWVPINRHTLIRGGLKQSQEGHLLREYRLALWASVHTNEITGNSTVSPYRVTTSAPYTNLKCGPLISETIEDTTAAAQEVVHASVCIVQVGVQL